MSRGRRRPRARLLDARDPTVSADRTTGIVLAGGASRRFGSDKLAASVDGRSVLDRAIDAVAAVVDEVIVVVAPGDDRPLPPGSRRVADATAFQGPLAGLATGLAASLATGVAGDHRGEAAPSGVVLVVGGDMPALRPAVLRQLVAAVHDGAAGAVLHDGRAARPLPAAYRSGTAAAATQGLLERGERRLRALPVALDAAVVPLPAWRPLDPDAATLLDVDRPADLDRAVGGMTGSGAEARTPDD